MAAPVAAIAVRTIGRKRMLQIVAAIIVLALALLISAVALPVMAVTMLGNGVAVGAEPEPAPGAGGDLVPSDQGWWRPTSGPITSWYGPRRIICGGTGCSTPFHQGIDFGTSCGTPVVSIYAGTVTFVGNAGGFGNRVIVDHGGGISSVYGHLAPGASVVTVGQQVEGGFQISQVGRTGVVSGCHLDLKITINGAHTDPAPFLRGKGITL